jgi:hypothetical protein
MAMEVEPYNTQVLGPYPATDNLVMQILPGGTSIDIAHFMGNRTSGPLRFGPRQMATCRMGVFKVVKDGVTRIVFIVLPAAARAERILLFVTQAFGQAAAGLAWLKPDNPLSMAYIREMMLKHVINRYAPQTIAGAGNVGLFYVLRVLGNRELGPFETDGAVWRECLEEIQTQTNDAFDVGDAIVATYSNGIESANRLMPSLSRAFSISKVINIDPAKARGLSAGQGVPKREFLSGQTGGPKPGFDYFPLERWRYEAKLSMIGTTIQVHDWARMADMRIGVFIYLHNIAMPEHMLFLGLRT